MANGSAISIDNGPKYSRVKVQAFVHVARIEPVGELFRHLVSDGLQVCVDCGLLGRGSNEVERAMPPTLIRQNSSGAAGRLSEATVALLTAQTSCATEREFLSPASGRSLCHVRVAFDMCDEPDRSAAVGSRDLDP